MYSNRAFASDERVMVNAIARVESDLRDLQPDGLVQVILNAAAAASMVLRVLPRVKALRERLATELPGFDLGQFDKLEDYALALLAAHARFRLAILRLDDSALDATGSGTGRRLPADPAHGTLAEAADLRLRALNLVLSTYEEARRAVHHLRRRQGDADRIIPSLYFRNSQRRLPDSEHPTLTGIGPRLG